MIQQLQTLLQAEATEATRAWFDAYMKGVITFRGLKMPQVNAIVQRWLDLQAPQLEGEALLTAALQLLREEKGEDKLAGILLLQQRGVPAGLLDPPEALDALGALFDEGCIQDWSTCDWLCVKVLGPQIKRSGEEAARELASWQTASTLWRRRAAGVAFVNLASQGEANFTGFTDLVLEICATTVADPARFAQTGTGWVLRELAVAEPHRVLTFTEAHLPHLSAEGLRYITEKTLAAHAPRLRAERKRLLKERRVGLSDARPARSPSST